MDKAPASSIHGSGDIMSGTQTQTQTQTHGGALMRYHSAPSSVFASLLHSQDALRQTTLQLEDSELARVFKPNSLLSNVQNGTKNASQGCIRAFNSHAPAPAPAPHSTLSTRTDMPQVATAVTAGPPLQCVESDESGTSGHPSSIFKHSHNNPCANPQTSVPNSNNCTNSELSSKLDTPESLSSVCLPYLSAKSNLIRHSSFPAEILSRLGEEKSIEGPMLQFAGTYMPRNNSSIRDMHRAVESIPYDKVRSTHVEAAIPNDNMMSANSSHDSTRDVHVSHPNTISARSPLPSTGWPEHTQPLLAKGSSFNGKSTLFHAKEETNLMGVENWSVESPLSVTQSSLFRHSSLPASLLSRLSSDGPIERVSSSGNSSEEDKRMGGARFSSRISGFWNEAGTEMTAFGQRKRGREVEDKVGDGFPVLESIQGCSVEEDILQWNFGGSTADTSSGSLLSLDDSVLCRVRAKRGCATHPRSIAERVRRTKISDGMRKLQELVPNMEKQTNTATMLDEAVEYVKFLQQQVQNLSESQSKCNGRCHSKGST